MISKITSINDKIVDNVVKLKVDKKFRYESGLFVVEGIRMVRDALKYCVDIKSIFIDKTRADYVEEFTERGDSYIDLQFKNAGARRLNPIQTFLTESYILNKMSSQETPQGILATVAFKPQALTPPKGNAVILDRIQDPGNAGSIIRSALATAAVTDIYFVNSVDPYNPKTVKSSMSAIYHLNIHVADSAKDILPFLRDTAIFCADLKGEDIFRAKSTKCFSLVIGSEGSGVGEEFKAAANRTFTIPMDYRVESLNAAASASVILFILARQYIEANTFIL